MGEFFTKFGKRAGFDLPDQVSEHVVEQADLLAVEIVCTAEEKIGYAPENFGASIARARGQNIFELFDDGRGLRHFLSWAGSFLPPSTTGAGHPRRCTLASGRKAMVKPTLIALGPKSLCFKIA